ncbi:hypothetical protein Aduo_016920 [Ancylostoma duodenale]
MSSSLRSFSIRSPLRSEIFFSKPVIVLFLLFLIYTIFNPSAHLYIPANTGGNEKWQKKIDPSIKPAKLLSKNQRDADLPYCPSINPKQLIFSRRPETAHIECGRALRHDKHYVKLLANRILPPKQLPPLIFGVAFARVVYKDYEFLEDELSFHHSHKNSRKVSTECDCYISAIHY